jgi:hypothetical protein
VVKISVLALSRFTQPDSIIPDPYNPLDWDRYGYARNNSIKYLDPDGYRPCNEEKGCGESVDEVQLMLGRSYEGNWDSEAQKEATKNIEHVFQTGELLITILWEPADWVVTTSDCLKGDCSPLSVLGLLPLLPASKIDELAAALVVVNKRTGDAYRDEITAFFEKAGYIVRIEVVKNTPFGKRRIDIEVSNSAGELLGGIETKTGLSRYTPSQQSKDAWLALTGYIVNLMRRP